MKLLADENFLGPAVRALREEGFDVVWVLEDLPGATDEEVLNQSVIQGRTLLTFDKDFGYLAFHKGFAADFGIILFRTPMSSPDEVSSIATGVLRSRSDWAGHFSVVSGDRVRMTPLPAPRGH